MQPLTIVIIVILIVLLIFAFKGEIQDYQKVKDSPKVYDTDNLKEREELYKYYSTFCYDNTVNWRSNYILSCASAGALYFIFQVANVKMSLKLFALSIVIIYLIFYFGDNFKSYHFWRIIASKVKDDVKLL